MKVLRKVVAPLFEAAKIKTDVQRKFVVSILIQKLTSSKIYIMFLQDTCKSYKLSQCILKLYFIYDFECDVDQVFCFEFSFWYSILTFILAFH